MFRFNDMGAKIATNPAGAIKQLIALFGRHQTVAAVAAALGVDPRTVTRWIFRLAAAGYTVPANLRLTAGRPPQNAKLLDKTGSE